MCAWLDINQGLQELLWKNLFHVFLDSIHYSHHIRDYRTVIQKNSEDQFSQANWQFSMKLSKANKIQLRESPRNRELCHQAKFGLSIRIVKDYDLASEKPL